jgi:hypothetical protein
VATVMKVCILLISMVLFGVYAEIVVGGT